MCVLCCNARLVRFHGYMRIEAGERCLGTLHLRLPDRIGVVDDLALQVRQRDLVVIDDADRADARGGKILNERGAETTCADDQHAGGFQLLLAGTAHIAQDDMSRVAFQFLRRKGHENSYPSSRLTALAV